MNIAIDIDDTLTNTFSYLQPYTAEYCKKPLEELVSNNISYDNTPKECCQWFDSCKGGSM